MYLTKYRIRLVQPGELEEIASQIRLGNKERLSSLHTSSGSPLGSEFWKMLEQMGFRKERRQHGNTN